jgi:hypothetical protein
MKQIIAKIDFTLHNKLYKKGKEVKVNSKEELIRLNERGFIEPFSYEEIKEYFIAIEIAKNSKKEGNKTKEEKKEGNNNE